MRFSSRVGALALLSLALSTETAISAAARARPSAPDRQPTPYMGVNTWYAFGPRIDEHTIVALTNAVVERGLGRAGYRYVWIDAGWWRGARNGNGRIELDPAQWPHGMRWLVSYIHSRGLRAGIYTDAGASGCMNGGSYGHYQTDIDTFAAWGFDALKADFCGGDAMHLLPRVAYRLIAKAILHDHPHRAILLNVCNGTRPGQYGRGEPPWIDSAYASYLFAPSIASSWRTGPDVGTPGKVQFDRVLRNLDLDSLHPGVAGHGHWNDPDYIVPQQGMSAPQARAQFTMWAIVAAPLMVGSDPETLSAATIAMLSNRGVIAISQDRLGIQGRRVAREGTAEVWVRLLAGGGRAIAFLNRGLVPAKAYATARMLELRGLRRFSIEDLWARRTHRAAAVLRATVAPDSVVLLRLSPRQG